MTVLALEVGQTDGRVWTQQGGMLGVWALPPSSVCLSICYLFTSGEENGNPLQYSCLENPMDGGAWWVTSIYLSLNFLWSAYVSVYASLHLWSVNHPSLIGLPLICLSVCLSLKLYLSSIIFPSLSTFCQAAYLSSLSAPGR